MKGFIIKSSTWGYQTHKVGLPEGCTISFEFSRWWGAIWCPSGYTNESEHWSWHGGDIHVGDEVEIEVIEITPEEVDAPSHVIRERSVLSPLRMKMKMTRRFGNRNYMIIPNIRRFWRTKG